ncbi:MAG: hypothetical protein ACEQSD_07655 [Flavobacteriales bacterium]
MTTTYKQAYNGTLAAGSNTLYTAPASTLAQVRALTAHNPTAAAVSLTISVNAVQLVNKSIAAGVSVVVSELLNHQVNAGQVVAATGTGLNLILSLAEVV